MTDEQRQRYEAALCRLKVAIDRERMAGDLAEKHKEEHEDAEAEMRKLILEVQEIEREMRAHSFGCDPPLKLERTSKFI